MEELERFWLQARESLLQLGDFGPGLFLCAFAIGLELVSDRFVAPRLAVTRPKMAKTLTSGFDGLRAGIVAAVPFGFTLELEFLVLGGLAGLATKLVKMYLSGLDGPNGPNGPSGPSGAEILTAESPAEDANGPGGVAKMSRGVVFILAALIFACSGPERRACLLRADLEAYKAGVELCGEHQATLDCIVACSPEDTACEESCLRSCPSWPYIEKNQRNAFRECRG